MVAAGSLQPALEASGQHEAAADQLLQGAEEPGNSGGRAAIQIRWPHWSFKPTAKICQVQK